MKWCAALLLLLVTACSRPVTIEEPAGQFDALPAKQTNRPAILSHPPPALPFTWESTITTSVVSVPTTQIVKHVTLIYTNAPIPRYTSWIVGVEGSTNLPKWYEVYRGPYPSGTNGVWTVNLSNRPPAEIYRSFYNTLQ